MVRGNENARTGPIPTLLAGSVLIIVVATSAALPRVATESGDGRHGAAEAAPPGRPAAGDPGAVPETMAVVGRVLDPGGRPVTGARLYLGRPVTGTGRYRGEMSSRDSGPPAARATTGADGRFRFAINRSDLASSDSVRIAAFAEGYGPAWTHDLKIGDPDGPDLRLAADDVPIAGRLIDMEGHPVPGVVVRVIQVDATPEGDLGPWLGKIAGKADGRYAYHHFTSTLPVGLASLIRKVTTGPDGRFRLASCGRERLVSLLIEGPKTETQVLHVMSRRGPSASVRSSRPDLNKPGMLTYEEVIRAVDFELVTAPTRPVEGVVRDRDTGLPLAGVAIRAEWDYRRSFPFHPFIDWPGMMIRTMTDQDGHYRLTGLPVREGVNLRVEPAEGQPYHTSVREAGNPPGLDPARLDFELKRGILVRGRVLDRATGGPVAAVVGYHPTLENVNVDRADRGHASEEHRPTQADGRFTLVAFPGPGLVAATGLGDRFLTADLTEEGRAGDARGFPKIGGFTTPHQCHAFAAIAPDAASDPSTCDLILTPGPEPIIKILDPDGRPLAGARVGGIPPADIAREGWWQSRQEPIFRVTGLTGHRIRVLLIHHEGRRLADTLAVRDNEPGPLVARLRPWGDVTGRLVDRDGRLRPGVRLSYRGPADDDRRTALLLPADATTDGEGRFSLEGLVPGLEYVLRIAVADRLGPRVGEAHVLEPGEVRSLGDVREVEP